MSKDLEQLLGLLDVIDIPILNNDMPIVYLASPYSDKDPAVMVARVAEITKITAAYIEMCPECIVYSPIAYTDPLSRHCEPESGWYHEGLKWLKKAKRLVVVQMDGWEESRGVLLEIGFALGRGIPIDFFSPEAILNWKTQPAG